MAVTRVTHKGFLSNLMSSIVGIPIGILLFLASFYVLFINEGRTDWSKVAAEAAVADPAAASGHDGEFVTVTGPLTTDALIGDPEYTAPGNYISFSRTAEMYAWVENSSSTTRDKIGGGTETVTTYTYELEWTSSPESGADFQEAGHNNPPMTVEQGSWLAPQASVGAWTFATESASGQCFLGSACRGLPAGDSVSPTALQLTGAAAAGTIQGDYVYLMGASPTSSTVGDVRISFSALPVGGTVTAFANVEGGQLVPHVGGEESIFRIMSGDRAGALERMHGEFVAKGWIFRLIGFLMMWIGMQMVFGPLQAIAGILPFVKKITGFIIGLITGVIALALTTVTVILSMILHSWILASLIGIGIFGFIVWTLWKKRQAPGAAPAGAASFAPPPGPPPGFAPPGAPPGPPPVA